MFDCRTCCTNTGTHAAFEARPTRGKLRGGGVWSAAETFLSQGFCQSVKYSTSVPQYLSTSNFYDFYDFSARGLPVNSIGDLVSTSRGVA